MNEKGVGEMCKWREEEYEESKWNWKNWQGKRKKNREMEAKMEMIRKLRRKKKNQWKTEKCEWKNNLVKEWKKNQMKEYNKESHTRKEEKKKLLKII